MLVIDVDTEIDISDRKLVNIRKSKQQNNYRLFVALSVTEDIFIRI